MTRSRRGALLALLIMAVIAFTAACGDDSEEASVTDPTGTTWVLTTLDGEPVPDSVTADLTFDGTMVSGTGGCNQFNGAATIGDGVVDIAPALASTMMACEPEISEVEDRYFTMLTEVVGYTVDGDTLILTDDAGATRAEFTATEGESDGDE